jgi:hypothetical protein
MPHVFVRDPRGCRSDEHSDERSANHASDTASAMPVERAVQDHPGIVLSCR